ncbi:MAG: nucleoside triphosphate pyrophosphohydrolase [Bacteroidales bacterium]|nr:nucleoside triphosphate pyrophosphohydrolase [Bacteroidales bacterium]MDD3011584.1 nucleoside triphosphate pyrophosphohydrolase [Bacteroidales bacterium]MDD3962062.1 nucleoside triphosphate pyrophosphohydrolase [Bacteroidales bacterium]MDY0286180.1 nucleoside triphosphate pyrophosphohydrolase [Bacteroidales bacterium]HPE86437.1 nucleoside triphosphate pyrophosphohydrolase [Bacteroidales bacterium]
MDRRINAFQSLLDIIDKLRKECPWDKKQTLESLRYLTIEETYELSDAILEQNLEEIKKELGDIMLHLVFYAKIGQEKNAFDIADVLEGINEKLIRRHPHIFGDVIAQDEKTVKDNWEKIKLTEGRKSVLSGVPKSLPAMVKAYRMQEKASGVGFDWENTAQVWTKVEEEMQELKTELSNGAQKDRVEDEFGDLLFALINYARFIGVNPDDALEHTNKKFIRRFTYLEEEAKKMNKPMHTMTLGEMEAIWQESKKTDR